MSPIEIAEARPEDRVMLENMLQLYIHDFSEFWPGGEEGELGDDGRFAPYGPLDAYWREPGRFPLLIRRKGRPIGFALINDHAHSGLAAERNMAEFFIVRKHRREGAGTLAARAVFVAHPGLWEVAVARRNLAALAFWRRAVHGDPAVTDVQELDVRSEDWDGPILRFHYRAA